MSDDNDARGHRPVPPKPPVASPVDPPPVLDVPTTPVPLGGLQPAPQGPIADATGPIIVLAPSVTIPVDSPPLPPHAPG